MLINIWLACICLEKFGLYWSAGPCLSYFQFSCRIAVSLMLQALAGHLKTDLRRLKQRLSSRDIVNALKVWVEFSPRMSKLNCTPTLIHWKYESGLFVRVFLSLTLHLPLICWMYESNITAYFEFNPKPSHNSLKIRVHYAYGIRVCAPALRIKTDVYVRIRFYAQPDTRDDRSHAKR